MPNEMNQYQWRWPSEWLDPFKRMYGSSKSWLMQPWVPPGTDWPGPPTWMQGLNLMKEDPRYANVLKEQARLKAIEAGPMRDETAGLPSGDITGGYGKRLRERVSDKKEEFDFEKYMQMQFLSKLIERPKAPSAAYPTRAGTARSPVATSIMQTHPGRRQDDLLNYIYGPSYGRRV